MPRRGVPMHERTAEALRDQERRLAAHWVYDGDDAFVVSLNLRRPPTPCPPARLRFAQELAETHDIEALKVFFQLVPGEKSHDMILYCE
jgi:hypothetical protein